MEGGYFITGTDTGIGKTYISRLLMESFKAQGKRVVGMKPVASGCRRSAAGLRNDDALTLKQAASIEVPYEQVNPYAFEPAVAPHIAAQRAGVSVDLERIATAYHALEKLADVVVVEGVGGWRVPLNDSQEVADLASRLDLPVILVVGLRLGCINHALLSAESIRHKGLTLRGWVANHADPGMAEQQNNIDAIRRRIGVPLLGEVDWGQTRLLEL